MGGAYQRVTYLEGIFREECFLEAGPLTRCRKIWQITREFESMLHGRIVPKAGCEIVDCAKCQWQAKMRNWHTKKIFGWPNERKYCKPKYSWIANTNSDGTPIFFLFHACPVKEFNLTVNHVQITNRHLFMKQHVL